MLGFLIKKRRLERNLRVFYNIVTMARKKGKISAAHAE